MRQADRAGDGGGLRRGDEGGANVSFSGIYGTSRDLHDTNGQWETLTSVWAEPTGQKEITVMARLGGYGARTPARRSHGREP